MKIVCQQTIFIKHSALFVIFEKKTIANFEIIICCNFYGLKFAIVISIAFITCPISVIAWLSMSY